MRRFGIFALVTVLPAAIAVLLFSADSDGPANAATGGPVFVSGDDAEDHCQGTDCGGLYPAIFKRTINKSQSPGQGILVIGGQDTDTSDALTSWNSPANGGPGVTITKITGSAIDTVNFANFAVIFVPSNEEDGGEARGISNANLGRLNNRKADIQDFVNNLGGGLIALTEADASPSLAFGFLPLPLQFSNVEYTDVTPTAAMDELAPSANNANMDHDAYHNVWTGPEGFLGLKVLAVTPEVLDGNGDPSAAILGGAQVILATPTTTPNFTATPTPTASATPTATLTPTPTPTTTPQEGRLWGDIDCNDLIKPADATRILQHDAGQIPTTPPDCFATNEIVMISGVPRMWADVDCNGLIKPNDSTQILQHDAGNTPTPKGDCPKIGSTVIIPS